MKSYTQYQPKARFLCLTHLKDYKEADNIKWLIQMDYRNPYRIGADGNRDQVLKKYREYLAANPSLVEDAKKELRGKNLACWCKPSEDCHADILLEIANKG